MGNYQLLVSGSGFAVVNMGGENGYGAEINENEYKELKDCTCTINEVYEQIAQDEWIEIVGTREIESGEILSIESYFPGNDDEN